MVGKEPAKKINKKVRKTGSGVYENTKYSLKQYNSSKRGLIRQYGCLSLALSQTLTHLSLFWINKPICQQRLW